MSTLLYRMRTARNSHRCYLCTGIIPVGEKHWDVRWVYEGSICAGKDCVICAALIERTKGHPLYEIDIDADDGVYNILDWFDKRDPEVVGFVQRALDTYPSSCAPVWRELVAGAVPPVSCKEVP